MRVGQYGRVFGHPRLVVLQPEDELHHRHHRRPFLCGEPRIGQQLGELLRLRGRLQADVVSLPHGPVECIAGAVFSSESHLGQCAGLRQAIVQSKGFIRCDRHQLVACRLVVCRFVRILVRILIRIVASGCLAGAAIFAFQRPQRAANRDHVERHLGPFGRHRFICGRDCVDGSGRFGFGRVLLVEQIERGRRFAPFTLVDADAHQAGHMVVFAFLVALLVIFGRPLVVVICEDRLNETQRQFVIGGLVPFRGVGMVTRNGRGNVFDSGVFVFLGQHADRAEIEDRIIAIVIVIVIVLLVVRQGGRGSGRNGFCP